MDRLFMIRRALSSVMEGMAEKDERLTKREVFDRVQMYEPRITSGADDRSHFDTAFRQLSRQKQVRVNKFGKSFVHHTFYAVRDADNAKRWVFVDNMKTKAEWDSNISIADEKIGESLAARDMRAEWRDTRP